MSRLTWSVNKLTELVALALLWAAVGFFSIALMLSGVSASAQPLGQRQVWTPKNCHECDKLIGVYEDIGSGRVTLFVEPSRIYQKAAYSTPLAGVEGWKLHVEEYEVVLDLAAEHAAREWGFKAPENRYLMSYVLVEADLMPSPKSFESPGHLIVFGNGNRAYWIVVYKLVRVPVLVESGGVLGGAK